MPVVAIVGQAATMALGGSYQQEVDLQTLFRDVSEYNYTISSPTAMRHVVDRAMRTAKGMRGVATMIFPKTCRKKPYRAAAQAQHRAQRRRLQRADGHSATDDLQRAAEILNGANKVAMLVGAGARMGADEVIAVADKLEAGMRKSAARKRRAARRSALGDRNDRPARNAPEFRHDERVRRAADGRHQLSVRGVSAGRRSGARRADRSSIRATSGCAIRPRSI